VFTACADLRIEAAQKQGAKYGIPAVTVPELLAREDVDLVLNLTIPAAHAEVSLAAIDAGKHVYTEKPLATELADGIRIMEAARAKGVRVGAAPDTVLGAGVQAARKLLDDGTVGDIITGTAAILSHGMEHWHPNPDFFFKPGAGPVFDMGPYYISALVAMLGPVSRVNSVGKIAFKERLVTAEGPMKGQSVTVETLTTVNSHLTFASGADIMFMASWDVWAHGQRPLELHGKNASLRLPDPNFFGGDVELAVGREGWKSLPTTADTFGKANWPVAEPKNANYRGLGIADLGAAVREGRPHRASGDVALHVLAVMSGVLESALENRAIDITVGCDRPAAMSEAEAAALLA
jgi:predicted dehydrogenase